MRLIKRLLKAKIIWDEAGATAVEYAVMLAMIIIAVIASVGSVGVGTGGLWSNTSSELSNVMGS